MLVVSEAGVPRPGVEVMYAENLRVADLRPGRCDLPAGATEPQQPRTEDETHIVVAGRDRFRIPEATADVQAGSVPFGRAGGRPG